jgi:23S rRNA (adenine2503-C2)-methyltransferase
MIQIWDRPAPEQAMPLRPNAAGLGLNDLRALADSLGQADYRADQLMDGLYAKRWTRWEQFTNLPLSLRQKLDQDIDLHWPLIVESARSQDASTKHLFQLRDGKQIEGVHMPYEKRTTLCLSSQVGCAMACTFCATGQMGIIRNLGAAEIVGQVMAMLTHHGHPETPINIVFMGMGEPLHNLDHVMHAFDILTHPKGLAIPARRITVSTSGLVSGIEKLGSYEKRPRLALSLNATTDEYRSKIMPVNRVWNLDALSETLKAFPLQKNERITLEYVLLKGVTDALEDGRRLAVFAKQFPSKVNLIPFNPHEGSGFEPPSETRIHALCELLRAERVTVSVRRSRGQDVAGACGQLIQEGQGRKR